MGLKITCDNCGKESVGTRKQVLDNVASHFEYDYSLPPVLFKLIIDRKLWRDDKNEICEECLLSAVKNFIEKRLTKIEEKNAQEKTQKEG